MSRKKALQDTEILVYNLKQIIESLKKAEKLTKFLESCNLSKTDTMRWMRLGIKPKESSIKPICDKLGIDINDIYFKKLNIKLNQNIDVKFEEEIEDALYYNINEICKCLLKNRKYNEIIKEVKLGRDTINTWKKRKKTPRKETLKRLCDKLGIDINDIYFKKLNINIIKKIEIKFEEN